MSLIKNRPELLKENETLRKDALDILEAGLLAINTEKVLKAKLTINGDAFCVESLSEGGVGFQCQFFERIFFIGIGKCAFDGAKVIEDILGDKLTEGIVLDVKAGVLKRIKSYQGTHPFPSETNVSVTKQILEMVADVTEKDLVIVLISGGGSSLLCLPHEINCESLTYVTRELFEKGADIFELNTVRKHLSEVQGGGLAKLLFPAQVASLIFSDVLGDDLGMIASGPTVRDETTVADAQNILKKYKISQDLISGSFIETPKDSRYFAKVKNFLLVSNLNALEAMNEKAEELGYESKIETDIFSGNALEAGKKIASMKIKPKSCVLFGGETTFNIKGKGVGGRNQELALSALSYVPQDTVIASLASDGWDNTPHAGAMADKAILKKAKSLKLDPKKYLEESDSFNFWKKIGDGAISTGRLGSNVSDLIIMISSK